LKVLLVDDDNLAAEKDGRALRFGGFEAMTVSGADAALCEIAADPVDVVLIDLQSRLAAVIERVRQLRAREHGSDNTRVLTERITGSQWRSRTR
jgi:DNA-binding response OmpR family regulator